MLASAVTYLAGGSWKTETASLPRYYGHSDEAEVYALKMAFDLAVRHVIDDGLNFANVVFFTDSKNSCRLLAGVQDTRRSIGPIPTEGKWALEDIYDAADKLGGHGTKVVVAWVKAHSGGYGVVGNRTVDAACREVIDQQVLDQVRGLSPSRYELPE
jgi:ribonuclease HI